MVTTRGTKTADSPPLKPENKPRASARSKGTLISKATTKNTPKPICKTAPETISKGKIMTELKTFSSPAQTKITNLLTQTTPPRRIQRCSKCEVPIYSDRMEEHETLCKGTPSPPPPSPLPVPQLEDKSFFDVFVKPYPRPEGKEDILVPHNLEILERATETMLKAVQMWGQVLDDAVWDVEQDRDGRSLKAVKGEDREGKGEMWEAYAMWSAVMEKALKMGMVCRFTEGLDYIDRAVGEGESKFVWAPASKSAVKPDNNETKAGKVLRLDLQRWQNIRE